MEVRVGGHGTYKFGCKEESSRNTAHAQEAWAQLGSSRQSRAWVLCAWREGERKLYWLIINQQKASSFTSYCFPPHIDINMPRCTMGKSLLNAKTFWWERKKKNFQIGFNHFGVLTCLSSKETFLCEIWGFEASFVFMCGIDLGSLESLSTPYLIKPPSPTGCPHSLTGRGRYREIPHLR